MLLLEYLKSIYPESDDEEITFYLSLIENNEQDKLPPTKEVRRYIKVSKLLKKLEVEQEILRKEVINQYDRLKHQIKGLSISKPTPSRYDQEKLYEWFVLKFGEDAINDCRTEIIDKSKVESKIGKMLLSGELTSDDLPTNIYKNSEQTRIELEGSRSRKK